MPPELTDLASSPPEQAVAGDRFWRVADAIVELPADQAGLLELACFHDPSHTEIAAQLGLPLGTIKT